MGTEDLDPGRRKISSVVSLRGLLQGGAPVERGVKEVEEHVADGREVNFVVQVQHLKMPGAALIEAALVSQN